MIELMVKLFLSDITVVWLSPESGLLSISNYHDKRKLRHLQLFGFQNFICKHPALIKCSNNNQHLDTYHVPGIVLNLASRLLNQLTGVPTDNGQANWTSQMTCFLGFWPRTLTSRTVILVIVMFVEVTDNLNAYCDSRVGGKPSWNRRAGTTLLWTNSSKVAD